MNRLVPVAAAGVLGLGLVLNAVGDAIYLVQTADGTWQEGSWVNALWPASSLLVGLAAWQPMRLASAPKDHSLRVVIVPVVCGVGAVGLLAYDHFSSLNGMTVALAAVALLLVLVRTALVFAENQRVLAGSRREASPVAAMARAPEDRRVSGSRAVRVSTAASAAPSAAASSATSSTSRRVSASVASVSAVEPATSTAPPAAALAPSSPSGAA